MSKGSLNLKTLCPIIHKFSIICNSKLCISYGFKYSSLWSQNIMTVKLEKKPWRMFPNFTGKTKNSSLISTMVALITQRVLSDISEDTSHVHLL